DVHIAGGPQVEGTAGDDVEVRTCGERGLAMVAATGDAAMGQFAVVTVQGDPAAPGEHHVPAGLDVEVTVIDHGSGRTQLAGGMLGDGLGHGRVGGVRRIQVHDAPGRDGDVLGSGETGGHVDVHGSGGAIAGGGVVVIAVEVAAAMHQEVAGAG